MNLTKILQFYQDLGVDEVISSDPINRLQPKLKSELKNNNFVQDIVENIENEQSSQNVQNSSISSNDVNIIVSNFGNMTQSQAIMRLAQKQQAMNPANVELTSILDMVKDVQNIVDKIDNLDDLEKAVRNFDGCSLKKMATNTVFSDGNSKAKIMIIGEAPGNHEDLQGIPFCGDSGKLLDQMFLAINKSRANELYITNTLFWRPPGNRRPTNDELALCRPFVEKHVALIKPELIVLMGATAMSSVLGIEESISKIRGRFLEYQNQYLEKPIKTITLFHPSYLMRQPNKKRLAWKDLILIDNFLKNIA